MLCSANKGDSLDRSIDAENSQTDDFIILVCVFWLVLDYYLDHSFIISPVLVWGAWTFNVFQDDVVEAPEEASKKVKLFFAYAADRWDAQFYAKANDNIYVNMGKLAFYSLCFLGYMDNVVDLWMSFFLCF